MNQRCNGSRRSSKISMGSDEKQRVRHRTVMGRRRTKINTVLPIMEQKTGMGKMTNKRKDGNRLEVLVK